MSNELNDRLRAALHPVDPGESFTQKVLARIANEPEASDRPPSSVRMPLARALSWRSAVVLAAVLAVGTLIAHGWQEQRVQDGLEARREVMEALQLTSEKLDLAYQAVEHRS